ERAQRVGEAAVELGEVVALVEEALDEAEDVAVAAVGDDAEQLQIQLLAHEAEDLAHVVGGDGAVGGEGADLVEEGERVAHPALGAARDRDERVGGDLDPLGLEDLAKTLHDPADAHPTEIEALAAREDRRRGLLDALWLRRREDEDHPRRRLLEDLEERVP